MTDLQSKVPAQWVSAVRPFLQRADEFQAREPVVSYYLRTHVAYLCMQKRSKGDKEGTAFLMSLLESLEAEKKALGPELEGTDGRTVLTRFALMLFAKADDEERAGRANLGIVRLFFASSILFEATRQFTDDGEMDRIAAEKCKYAKYIAATMKKALDAGQPYVSPNPVEAAVPTTTGGEQGGEEVIVTAPLSTAPPSSYIRKPVPPSLPSAELGGSGGAMHIPQQQQQQPQTSNMAGALPSLGRQTNLAPPSYAPPPATTASNGRSGSPVAPPSYAPPAQVQPSQVRPAPVAVTPTPKAPAAAPVASYTPPATTGPAPSVEDMIDAQKFARQAISALQFYDHNNARQQLIAALNILDGAKKR